MVGMDFGKDLCRYTRPILMKRKMKSFSMVGCIVCELRIEYTTPCIGTQLGQRAVSSLHVQLPSPCVTGGWFRIVERVDQG